MAYYSALSRGPGIFIAASILFGLAGLVGLVYLLLHSASRLWVALLILIPVAGPIIAVLLGLTSLIRNWRLLLFATVSYVAPYLLWSSIGSSSGSNTAVALLGGCWMLTGFLFLCSIGYRPALILAWTSALPWLILGLIAAFDELEHDLDVLSGGGPTASPVSLPYADPPQLEEVAGHLRSHPDGVLSNNFSEGGSGTPGQNIEIAAYLRSTADGITSNNLSGGPGEPLDANSSAVSFDGQSQDVGLPPGHQAGELITTSGVLAMAGWFADPSGSSLRRYWNGSEWTDWFADQNGGMFERRRS